MATVLLEIGTEEMPAGVITPALAQLAELARARFAVDRLPFAAVQTWGTPRRLALLVSGVADHQTPAVREVRGPTVEEAFDAHGEPTAAALGFARSQGVTVSQLRLTPGDGAEYLAAIFRDEGQPTAALLPALCTHLVTSLTFPRVMRWGGSPLTFTRPIRWLVALLDDRVVPVVLGDITAGRATRGHRFLAPGEVEIATAADYPRVMDENHVLLSADDRRAAIREQMESIAAQDNASIADDGTLLEETAFRVEFPTAVRCNFDADFLSLPDDVLLQTLREEQKFFPLVDGTGRLLPAFIAVRNGDKAYLGTVREGYEAVARAKLLDALFFFEQDRARPLAERVEDLRGVIFQERIGTLHDKALRLQTLAECIAAVMGLPAHEGAMAARAALLAKADLVTAMVTEHPGLQGIMGRVYAREAGEPEPVALAIGEHICPNEAPPATPIGCAVALADKLDTAAACFAVGLVPTGQDDPYQLRREADSVARILVERGLRLSVPALLDMALAALPVTPAQPLAETRAALEQFFQRRVEALLAAEGLPGPTLRAALAVSAGVPADAAARARTLRAHAG